MRLRLYTGFSKRKNSTKRPSSNYIEVNVKLKNNTSLVNPIFIIGNDVNLFANYCYVVEANRYYYIDDIILGNNNLYEIQCSSDVLATFKDAINGYTCFVERSASNYNSYLPDPAISSSTKYRTVTEVNKAVDWYDSAGSFIVRINGLQTALSDSGLTTYVLSKAEIKGLMEIIYASAGSSIFDDIINDEDYKAISQAIFDPAKYIVSCTWIPIQKSLIAGAGQTIFCGQYNTGKTAQTLDASTVISITSLPSLSDVYGDFRDYSDEWTKYNVYLPLVGNVPVSSKYFESGLEAAYIIDPLTGTTQCHLRTTSNHLIASYSCNAGVNVPLAGLINNTAQTIGSVVNGIGFVASGNIPGVVASTIGAVSSAIQPTPSIIGNQGSLSIIKTLNKIVVSKSVLDTADIPISVYGRTCCKNLSLGSLTGFIKCANASLDVSSMGNDKEAINSYLNNGFYNE